MTSFTRFTSVPFLACVISLIVSLGCGTGNGSSGPTEPQGTVTGKLAAQSVYLSKPSDEPTAIDANSVTLPGNRPEIHAGTVLVSSRDTGFIRKVTSSTTASGKTICQTTSAGLPDAFTELHLKAQPQFDRATVGDITSGVPGLTFTWVDAPASKSASTRATSPKALQLDFSKLGLSGSGSGSFSVSGTVDFQATTELDLDIDTAPGSILPSLDDLNVAVNCTMTGTLTLSASGSGQIAAKQTWFDKNVGPPIVVGWLVFVNHLTVESDLNGEASGDITHSQTVNANATAGVTYTRGGGWSTTGTFNPSLGATETNVDAEFGLTLIPVKVTLKCELYGLVGAYGTIDANITGSGVKQLGPDPVTGNQVEGIQADVNGGLEGSIGISNDLPNSINSLLGLKGTTPPSKDFTLASTSLYSHFFPLTGQSEIVVIDNGDASDSEDVFSVTLDGGSLGFAAKGSSGSYDVNNLSPGTHTISVTYVDQGNDGETGDPPASLEIDLNNGLTFSDGTTTVSQDNLPFNVAQSYTIVVPTKGKQAQRSVRIRRVHTGHKSKTRLLRR